MRRALSVGKKPPTKKFQAKVPDMNIALSFLNAAALVALVTFHFVGDGGGTEQVNALALPSHVLHQAPQLAVMHRQSYNQAMLANDSDDAMPVSTDRSERWVF
jgi:hypothetical protein